MAGDCIIGMMRQRVIWLAVFTAAFAYIESSIVVYLREIYFPGGFAFPFLLEPDRLAAIELGREVCTILVLWGAGTLMGRDAWERFLWFCATFAVWDILYYFWLKVLVDWPESLLTLDVLFLVPIPWVAPVLAPLLIAVSMMIVPVWFLRLKARGATLTFPAWQWLLAIGGGMVCILSFTLDYTAVLEGRMPEPFKWWLFLLGLAMAWAAVAAGTAHLRRPGGPA